MIVTIEKAPTEQKEMLYNRHILYVEDKYVTCLTWSILRQYAVHIVQ